MAGISLPFAGLVSRHQVPEALIWLTVTILLLLGEVASLRRGISSSPDEDVLYIGEDGKLGTIRAALRKYGFQARK
jgi:hypothetical protein